MVLQGVALLAHLRLAGHVLVGGWRDVCVDEAGRLRGANSRPGTAAETPQTLVRVLLARLFGAAPGELPGRGEARRVLRGLLADCGQDLVPIAPDAIVARLLAAPLFRRPALAGSRAALGAEHFDGDARWLWVAGPGGLRRNLLAGARNLEELGERLATSLPRLRRPARRPDAEPSPGGTAFAGESLREVRRSLGPSEAASQWADLAVTRIAAADLGGAERAARHAVRLDFAAAGGRTAPRALRLLAEARLRQGWSTGVAALLEGPATRREDSTANGASDAELWARLDLLRGRPQEALDRLEEALRAGDGRSDDRRRATFRTLAARAAGWLGRNRLARRHLDGVAPDRGLLEAEEWPALFALAGRSREALEWLPAGAAGECWRAALGDREASGATWRALDRLGSYRSARLAADLEMVCAGSVPSAQLRAAARGLDRVGSRWLCDRVTEALGGPWPAVERYLAAPPGSEPELASLLRAVGGADVSLRWTRGTREEVIVDGRGGPARRTRELAGGTLTLAASAIEAPLRSLFELVCRDWRPAPAPGAPAGAEAFGVVGESRELVRAMERAGRFATGDLPVLITGESGTGKELVARWIHRHSARADRPFLPLNSAALNDDLVLSDLFGHVRGAFTGADRDRAGIFESARGGCVFLDELGDLPLRAQAMLLRVLQEGEVRRLGESRVRKVDARVLAATHRDLERRVADGRFREDLYYRLAVARVELPPLRDREGDLELLIHHFLGRLSGDRAQPRLSEQAWSRLRSHHWPGNVRELGNRLAVAVALAERGRIRARDLELRSGGDAPGAGGYHQRVVDFRRQLVRDALLATGGNQAAAARRLGVSRQALSYLVRTLGLR